MISPSCGFSLAVSGTYSPPRIWSVSSIGRTTTRSARGWILVLDLVAVPTFTPRLTKADGGRSAVNYCQLTVTQSTMVYCTCQVQQTSCDQLQCYLTCFC